MAKHDNSDRPVEGKFRARAGLRRAIRNVLAVCGLVFAVAVPVIVANSYGGQGEPATEEVKEGRLYATEPFDLEQGLAIVKMTHQGEESFVINLLSAKEGETDTETGTPPGRLEFFGDKDEGDTPGAAISLVDGAGPVDISRAVPVPIAGKHLFDVKADGPWTIQVEQPRPASAAEPTRFSGDDDTATPFFWLSSGPKMIDVTNPAGGEFRIILRDVNGNEIHRTPGDETDQAKQSDQPSVVSSVEIPEDGIYIFDVRADSLWTIEISDTE